MFSGKQLKIWKTAMSIGAVLRLFRRHSIHIFILGALAIYLFLSGLVLPFWSHAARVNKLSLLDSNDDYPTSSDNDSDNSSNRSDDNGPRYKIFLGLNGDDVYYEVDDDEEDDAVSLKMDIGSCK
ncbi:hypothetical protein BaRGS_00024013 [Batillaria attramentaria]|uniref:Uncharacterized protein n=1 Tax=Batillaria attramentaria TaxID=370345 RepID=A0ABD0KCA9_9CAEN